MFCSACGTQQPPAVRFCSSCGAPHAGTPSQHAQLIPEPAVASAGAPGSGATRPVAAPFLGYGSPSGPAGGDHSAAWVAAGSAAGPVDNTLAWTLAFAPLLFVLLDGILLAAGMGAAFAVVSLVVAVGINSLLGWADARRMRAAGYDVSTALAIFLVPVYLFRRASRTGQKLAIPVVWCICFVASFAGAGLIGNTVGVAMDVAAVEAEILRGIEDQAGVSGVTVDCPDSVSPRPGSSFQCIAEADGESVMVEVTVQNAAGEYFWRVS